jgi:serine protease
VPAAKVITLHGSYEKALAHVKTGKIAGVVYARGKQPRQQRNTAAGCSEPNCPLVYNGGSVQHNPKIYLLLWGPDWVTANETASYGYLRSFYLGLGTQPGDTWSRITEQYGDSSGSPSFSGSVYAGAWQDPSTPPQGVTSAQLAAEAYSFALTQGIPDWSNAQIVVATQSGTCPQGFTCPGAGGNYCAWHSNVFNLSYINLPYQLDAGSACGENTVIGPYDGFSIVGGHEYAETITDPFPDSGWWDPSDSSGGEIGDKCAWQGLGTVTLYTGHFAVQPLYSNEAYYDTGKGCTLAWPDNVSVTSPGGQSSAAHTSTSLQVSASSSGGYPLSYTATGLPPGLTINATSGLISGAATSTGSYLVTVSASDISGASGSAGFTWTITGPGDTVAVTNPGPVTSIVRVASSLQIHATSSGDHPLTFTATGLPPGLAINATSGLISGTATTTGYYQVSVTASDTTGDSAAAAFSWHVETLTICGTVCCGGAHTQIPCSRDQHTTG